MSSENVLIEDEIDIKMDPEEIPNTTDIDGVPDNFDIEQVPNMETDQVPNEMDIKIDPNEIDTEHDPERKETGQVAEDALPFDALIEDLATITDEPTIRSVSNPILETERRSNVDESGENITTDAEIKTYEHYKKKQNDKLKAKHKDAIERMKIIQNVLNKCKEIRQAGSAQEVPLSPIQKLHFFTKANTDYLAEVLQDYKPRNRSVEQAVLDIMPIPLEIFPFIYNDIRDIFVEFYLEKKQIPTKKHFLECLQEKGSKSSKEYYRNIKLRTLVKNNLVIYHAIPTLKRYILMENPELAYLRNKYLRHITKYRESGAKFVYVTAKSVNTEMGAMTLTLAASPTTGLIGQSRPILPTSEGFSLTIKNWLTELLPSLGTTAIIVLRQPRKKDATPTPYSTKDQMITWLLNKDIPTELDTNKCSLYQLVKRSKDNKDLDGFYDGVFTSAGLKVIVNPIEYENLNYFNAIYRECVSNEVGECDEVKRMAEFMEKMSQEDWMKLEEVLIEEEKQMIKEDREMETVIENILEMAKNGDLEEDDFPEGCEGDKFDNFDVHIGDILVD